MKRVILDTNIYGRIIERKEREIIEKTLDGKTDVIIYGFDVVRKELRKISSNVRYEGVHVRMALLSLYDNIAKTHIYMTTSLIKKLADEYYDIYRQLGGKEKREEIINDFLIVACASIHELDLVVSDDNRTMLNESAIKTYNIVNKLRSYSTPDFIHYDAFRRSIV
ncbi:MAG: hypothetical protein AABX14_00415 [Candidatus Aenigmatarchaeota archaeon]